FGAIHAGFFAPAGERPEFEAMIAVTAQHLDEGPRHRGCGDAVFLEATVQREENPLPPILPETLRDVAVDGEHRPIGCAGFARLTRKVERPHVQRSQVRGFTRSVDPAVVDQVENGPAEAVRLMLPTKQRVKGTASFTLPARVPAQHVKRT